jgi:hypothetical protein
MTLLQKNTKSIVIATVFIFLLVNLSSRITSKPLGDGDDRHNALMGINLSNSGVVSLSPTTDSNPDPSNYREPLPALGIATAAQIHKFIAGEPIGPEEYNDAESPRILKMINLFWGVLCLAAVWLVTEKIAKSFYLSLTATLATYYMFVSEAIVIDTLYSELQTAGLLMMASWALIASAESNKNKYFLLSGLFIGLLALTKAPFFYVFIALFLLFVFFALISHQKELFNKMGMLSFAFVITVSPWMIRNYQHFGKFEITQRGGVILLIRANYDLMTLEEVKGSIYYWAPGSIRQNVVKRLWRFSAKDFELGGSMQRLNRDILAINKDAERSGAPEDAISYYHKARAERIRLRNYYLDIGAENPEHLADEALQQEALEIITENPLRHVFMTVPFAWRGIWDLSFDHIPREWSDALNFVLFVVFVFAMPLLAWQTRDPKWLAFIILPIAMWAFYAFFSHNIVRYTRPAYPSQIVSVFLLAHYLLRSKVRPRLL